jgi:EmrB/QacA subfamily drug resistance transporter
VGHHLRVTDAPTSSTAAAAPGSAPPAQAGADEARWWTLGAVCIGVFMLLLDVTIVNVALPDISLELDSSLSGLQWVIDAYALSLAALLLTAGSLADLFGRRRVFVIGVALFTLGSLACGLAQDITFLCLARAFQGIGGAAMFATALALLSSAFTGKERGTAFGAFGATTGVAVAIGPVLGGVLTSGISWRWIFFVNIPICVAAIAIAVLKVRESQDPRAGRPDWFGFVSFSLALGALVYALIEAGQTSWGETRVVACLVAAVVLLAVFVVSQVKQRHPMLDLGLLRKPTFTGGLIAAFAISASAFSLLTYLVIYVQNVLGYSAVGTGVRFLFLSGAAFVVAAIAGRLTASVPAKWLIAPGFVVLGIGLVLMTGIEPGSGWTHLIPGLLVTGAGIGLINTPLASTAVGVVTPDRSGMASGVNSTFRQVGVATGIAALGSIFSHQVADSVRDGLAGQFPEGIPGQLTGALSNGQVQVAAQAAQDQAAQQGGDAAGSAAFDLVHRVGTSAVVDALNHIVLIGAVLAFAAAVACFLLIRQKDFVVHSGPPQGAAGPGAGSAGGATTGRVDGGPASGGQEAAAPSSSATGTGTA